MLKLDAARTLALNGLRHLAAVPPSDVAGTPRELVWSRDRITMYRYHGGSRSRRSPVLLVMSLVTRPAVFDLRPGSSLVEDLLADGYDVFLLDWGIPTPADSTNSLSTYCDEYLPRASAAAARIAGAPGVHLIGYCLGGTLSLLAVAGNPAMPVRSVVGLATPIDFTQLHPLLVRLLSDGHLDPDHLLDETGNVPAATIKSLFDLMQPAVKLATARSLWNSLSNDQATAAHRALIGWSNEQIPFPGGVFREIVELLFRRRLLHDGRVPLGGRDVDLRSIRQPVLSVVGERDNLVPPAATAEITAALAGVDSLALPAGHAGLFVGRQARKRCVPAIVDWLAARD
jgi:polyhydroxyalkanoate synthase